MEPGLHSLTAEEYHRGAGTPVPSLSCGVLKTLLARSPAHARLQHPVLNPDYVESESDRFDLGTAAHALLLEGEDRCYVVEEKDWRTKEAKSQRVIGRALGRTPLLRHQYDEARVMVGVAQAFMREHLREFAESGVPELALLWNEDRFWFRARPDLLLQSASGTRVLDYKTTSALTPEEFARKQMTSMGYDLQDAFYRRGMAAIGLPSEFLFLVQEDTAPYACYLVEPANSMREVAERKVERGIKLWTECLGADKWPGYPSDIYMAEAPTWAVAAEEAKL